MTSADGAAGSVAALSPDGSLLVSVGSSLRVDRLDATHRATVVSLGSPSKLVSDLSFGATSDAVVLAYSDGSVEVRSTRDGSLILRFASPGPCDLLICPSTVSMAGSLTSGRISASYRDDTRVWRILNDKVRGKQTIRSSDAFDAADLSAGGTRITALTFNNGIGLRLTIRSYRLTLAGWSPLRSITVPPDQFVFPSGCPCFVASPDGKRAAISGYNGLAMWNLDTGNRLWKVQAPIGKIWLGSDGTIYRTNVSGGIDGVSTGDGDVEFTLPFNSANLAVSDILTHRGRLTVLSGSVAGQPTSLELTHWTVALPDLVDAACREANRNLTAAEWSQDVGRFFPYERTCSAPLPKAS